MKRNGVVWLLLLLLCSGPSGVSGILPMREQWRIACKVLGEGEAMKAVSLFREFGHWYGNEPEVREPEFREMRFRLHGLACLQAGLLEEGIMQLEEWLSETTADAPYHAYIRFQLGSACLSMDKPQEAIKHWECFLQEHSDIPECMLVNWMWSDLELSNGDPGPALEHLQEILDTPRLLPTVRALALVATAFIQVSTGSIEEAAVILDDPGNGEVHLFRLWRSLLAPSLAHSFLAEEKAERAVRSCDWFLPAENLNDEFLHLRDSMRSAGKKSPRGMSLRQNVWNRHWENQLTKLDLSLGKLGENLDLQLLYSLKLRSLLKAQEAVSASCLAKAILESSSLPFPRLMAQAYETAIRACHLTGDWKNARLLAIEFLEKYPDDEALPEIIILNAQTSAGQMDFISALDQVHELKNTYPSHSSLSSWILLEGEWYLCSGQADLALVCFEGLAAVSPESWKPFLTFQQGRCRDSLSQFAEATILYRSVMDSGKASTLLAEYATTGILKIYLRQLDRAKFLSALNAYRKRFPSGENRHMVENLAGSFYLGIGLLEDAESCFLKVSRNCHPAADYAHEQLSSMYINNGDNKACLHHAVEWILQYRKAREKIPPTPFRDCSSYQQATGLPALNEGLLQTLLEDIDNGLSYLPAREVLSLVVSLWDTYKEHVPVSREDPGQWLEERAQSHFQENQISGYSAYLLYLAEFLQGQGRTDSADAKRIQVLQAADAEVLGESVLLAITRIADKYDFPEAIQLLELSLRRFPESSSRPDLLYLLAMNHLANARPDNALVLLREIHTDWKDSVSYLPAGMELARFLINRGSTQEAHRITSTLLECTDIPARDSAALLLMRAQAGFLTGCPTEAALSCMRILNLYPDFSDISQTARNLLISQSENITDLEQRNFLNTLKNKDDTNQDDETGPA